MSPEILLGEEFDLPTDIFSLGVILCEISARKLADDHNFKRNPIGFGIQKEEIYALADPDCPPAFLELCLECLAENPSARPTTRVILDRLRVIEAEILNQPSEGSCTHVGSVKFMSSSAAGKRAGVGPRIPSFGTGIGRDIQSGDSSSIDGSDEDLMEAVSGLGSVDWETSGRNEGTTGKMLELRV
jgi:LIM domain kinase 1